MAEPADEPRAAPGQSQQVHAERCVQVETSGCLSGCHAVRADNGLQRGDIFRAKRLIDLRLYVPGPLELEACPVDERPDLAGVGLDDEDIVGVYDLIAGRRAVNNFATKKTCDHYVFFGKLLEVSHELPDKPRVCGHSDLGHVAFDVECLTQGNRRPPEGYETPAYEGDE